MTGRELTPEQVTAILAKVTPMLAYLNKLVRPMQHKGFPLDDPLWEKTYRAQQAVLDLLTELRCGRQEKPTNN